MYSMIVYNFVLIGDSQTFCKRCYEKDLTNGYT